MVFSFSSDTLTPSFSISTLSYIFSYIFFSHPLHEGKLPINHFINKGPLDAAFILSAILSLTRFLVKRSSSFWNLIFSSINLPYSFSIVRTKFCISGLWPATLFEPNQACNQEMSPLSVHSIPLRDAFWASEARIASSNTIALCIEDIALGSSFWIIKA